MFRPGTPKAFDPPARAERSGQKNDWQKNGETLFRFPLSAFRFFPSAFRFSFVSP